MSFFSDVIHKFEASCVDRLLATWLPYPKAVSIEPINVCQLRCPLCPTGAQKLDCEPMSMSLETFKLILSKMPFIKTVYLYKAGEPFLNPDIIAMIRHASDINIDVDVNTNFSFAKPDDFFDDIVKSGLSRLVVSLDGTSQESYAKYRIGGNYDLVISNIRKLVDAKNRLGSSKPEIIWQFLVNRFNENEIATARDICEQLKITLDVQPLDVSDNVPDVELDNTIEERKAYWLGNNTKYIIDRYQSEVRYPLYQGICPQLFTRVVVTVDGKVLPCCEVWDKSSAFGDLKTESFRDIWFNQKYVNSRMRFFKRDFRPDVQTVCFRCKNFGTSPTLKDKLNLLVTVCRRNFGHWKFKLKVFHVFCVFILIGN